MDELEDSSIEQWRQLEERALEANAFLSPDFVLPAFKHLTPWVCPIFLMVFADDSADAPLVGLGVFEHSWGTRRLPLPHLKCYRSKHSYLDGLLIDADYAEAAVEGLFAYVKRHARVRHGLTFSRCSADSPLADLQRATAQRFGVRWFPDSSFSRPILCAKAADPQRIEKFLASGWPKTLHKKRTKLLQAGNFEFRVTRCGPEHTECVARFLELERMGWKGAEQSALACRPNETAFFHEMMAGFARDNRAVFAELLIDGRVVSSTSNLISGHAVFAFKIGWNTAYSSLSPGKLNGLERLIAAPQELEEFDFVDSCASAGSYLEDIWPSRRAITSGAFTSTVPASLGAWLSLRAVSRLRNVKQRLRRRR